MVGVTTTVAIAGVTATGNCDSNGINCLCDCDGDARCNDNAPATVTAVMVGMTETSTMVSVTETVGMTVTGDSNSNGGDCLRDCGGDAWRDGNGGATATVAMVNVMETGTMVGATMTVAMVGLMPTGNSDGDGGNCLRKCDGNTALVSLHNGTIKFQGTLLNLLPNANPTHSHSSSTVNLLHTRPDNLALANNPVRQEQTVDAHEDVGAKMESEVEECPKLLDIGVVCKFYEGPGVAGGAADFNQVMQIMSCCIPSSTTLLLLPDQLGRLMPMKM